MNEHTLALLEFAAIREELVQYSLSAAGQSLLDESGFLFDRAEILRQVGLAGEFRSLLSGEYDVSSLRFPEISPALQVLAKEGSVLEPEDLAAVGLFCRSAGTLQGSLRSSEEAEGLAALARELPDVKHVWKAVFRVVDEVGTVKEGEIPELKKLRKAVRDLQQDVQRSAAAYLQEPGKEQYWTSNAPALRDGRVVLPLHANYKNRIQGVVHEISSTGTTVFIEPADIVAKNNAIRENEHRYQQELTRILRELSGTLRGDLSVLAQLEAQVAYLDTLYARARYAIIHDCAPVREDGRGLYLSGARHPLLGKKAVPISVHLEPGTTTLIITGPNTGGKTVALKTVGLLALMHQFCMEIPADEGSLLPVFSGVYADIGDEQSIEQSLSTFSGHMKNISRIMKESDQDALVLLDELGAGTDPEEGAALAMSILDTFYERGCLTLVTSHHGLLKAYGYTREGAENASVEFDRRRLSPTYHLLTGVPGSSHAISVASQNGIPPHIIERAKHYLSEEQSDAAGLINELGKRSRRLRKEERKQHARRVRLRQEEEAVRKREEELAEEALRVRRQGVEELSRLAGDARKQLENLVRELREGELTREKTRSARAFLDDLSQRVESERREVSKQEEIQRARRAAPQKEEAAFSPGMEVLLSGSRKRGVIQRRAKGGSWVVATGSLKVTVPEEEMEPVGDAHIGADRSVQVQYDSEISRAKPAMELDVRGMRLEEAVQALQRQIEDAAVSGLTVFSIIHGKGEGVLQRGVRDCLADAENVSSYQFAAPEEGGFGKTIVYLKG